MKIAIATRDFATVGGHAGQARHWLLYDLARYAPGQLLPAPRQIDLSAEQVLHVFNDNAPTPSTGWIWWWPPAPATASCVTCAPAAPT